MYAIGYECSSGGRDMYELQKLQRDTKRYKIRKVEEDKEKRGERKGNCSSFIINMRKDPPF